MGPIQNSPLPRNGFILTEACVSIALVGLVLGVASVLLTQHARATEYFVDYRRAQLAVESCVDQMRIGAIGMVDSNFTDDAGITYEIRVSDGEEAWQPLRRVTVLAVVDKHKAHPARYSLNSYLAAPIPSRGNGQ
jgi:hypothetical protein